MTLHCTPISVGNIIHPETKQQLDAPKLSAKLLAEPTIIWPPG